MTRTTKKTIVFSLLGLFAIAAGIGFYLYNKGPVDVKHASGTKVIAAELYATFSKDSITAKKKYINNILEAAGTVVRISKNQQNQDIIFLKTNEAGAFINCTMEGPVENIKENDNIVIKGICTGMGMGDTDLGILGDVYLGRCYLVK